MKKAIEKFTKSSKELKKEVKEEKVSEEPKVDVESIDHLAK